MRPVVFTNNVPFSPTIFLYIYIFIYLFIYLFMYLCFADLAAQYKLSK